MTLDMQGVMSCSRYSFAPNSLHYCGPERQSDMLGYVQHEAADKGLAEILHRFDTLYKYLVLIASSNHIHDPFDRRVVEAYWVGNNLLARVKTNAFAQHLTDTLGLDKKLPKKKFTPMMNNIVSGIPHHNFHVMNIFIRTGHHAVPHTIPTMDSCRISWGVVERIGKQYMVKTQPLVYEKGKLQLGAPVQRVVTSIVITPKIGDWVSLHWGFVCDIVSPKQRKNLEYYTRLALLFANKNHILS